MQALPTATLYIFSACVAGTLAVYSWRRRTYPGASVVSLLMATITVWCAFHTLSAMGTDLDTILFWAQVQYIGIAFVPSLYLLFSIQYVNRTEQFRLWQWLLLFVPPLLVLLAVWTNSWHHLWWSRVGVDTSRSFGSLDVSRGPLFWMWFVYTYGCVLFGMGLFIQYTFAVSPLYRRQSQLVVVGSFFPILGNIAHVSGLQISFIDDPTPFLFAASGVVFLYAAYRYHFLDVAPIAHRTVYESIPDGVIVVDQQGMILSYNSAAQPILKTSQREWSGVQLSEALGFAVLNDPMYRLLSAPQNPQSMQVDLQQQDCPRHIELRSRPLLMNGSVLGTILLVRDVTELVRAQAALHERIAEVELVNRVARVANAVAHTENLLTEMTQEVISAFPWNRVFISLLQSHRKLQIVVDQSRTPTEALVGRTVPPQTYASLTEALEKRTMQIVSRDDPALVGSVTANLMDTLQAELALVVPLVHHEQTLGAMTLFSPLKRVVTVEEQRLFQTIASLMSEAVIRARLYDEADEANRLKATFLATVSHELRTPLSSIIGYTEMLKRNFFGELPDYTLEPLNAIERSGKTLLSLINDLLELSRMEAGHFAVNLFPTDVAIIIERIAANIRPQIYARGLTLNVELEPQLPLIQADPGRLEQVLTNLLSNAIKFTTEGDITLRVVASSTGVRISVQDTGIGIPPAQQEAIFLPFHQLDIPEVRLAGGAGLGLAISRRLIELMGGTLSLESQPDRGSTFFCDFPALMDNRDAANESLKVVHDTMPDL